MTSLMTRVAASRRASRSVLLEAADAVSACAQKTKSHNDKTSEKLFHSTLLRFHADDRSGIGMDATHDGSKYWPRWTSSIYVVVRCKPRPLEERARREKSPREMRRDKKDGCE